MKKSLMEKFIGQYVEVLIDVSISAKYETEEGLSEKSKPFVVSGWFTNYDDEKIYIGSEEGTISDYFNQDYVVHVAVSKPFDDLEEQLDSAEEPNDKESWS